MVVSTSSAGQVPAQRGPRLDGLAEALRGDLALPGTRAYARLCRSAAPVALRPVAVVSAADAYDVAQAVRHAGAHGLRVGVSCTGLGAPASMAGALLVHTGGLDECVVHPDGWARVGAGVRWSTLAAAAAAEGRAPVAAAPAQVGVVGSTTGGGPGPSGRAHGLASDRVRALDVVTGDGRLVRATADDHADLFRASRGGRGAAGIVTAVELDLVPLRPRHQATCWVALEHAPGLLRAWRTWSRTLPEQLGTSVALLPLPDRLAATSSLVGRPVAAVQVTGARTDAAATALLAPLRAAAPVLLEETGPVTVDADGLAPVGHSRALPLADLPDEAVDALLRAASGPASARLAVEVRLLGGAATRRGTHDSAVSSRATPLLLLASGRRRATTTVDDGWHALGAALAPWVAGFVPAGYGRGAQVYDPVTLERLRETVAVSDPDRVLVAADDAIGPVTP